jgi:hypothetical protein
MPRYLPHFPPPPPLPCRCADINHMFVKAYADVIMDWLAAADPHGELYDVEILLLRRHAPAVLRSFLVDVRQWQTDTPLHTFSGGEYNIYHTRIALLPQLPSQPYGSQDAMDLVIGYMADMELQFDAFLRAHAARPGLRVTVWRAEQYFTISGVVAMLDHLGLGPPKKRCIAMQVRGQPETW